MLRPPAAALLAACALALGCKSDSERLIDLRSDLRARLDGLYARYGGSGLANDARAEAEKQGSQDGGTSTAARLLGEIDRSYFEGYCLARGRGERPFSLSGKLDAFMGDAANQDACAEAAKLDARVRELEAKVGTGR